MDQLVFMPEAPPDIVFAFSFVLHAGDKEAGLIVSEVLEPLSALLIVVHLLTLTMTPAVSTSF